MNKYFLNDLSFERRDAGFKARRDVVEIVSCRGDFTLIHIPLWGGFKRRILNTPALLWFLLRLQKDDILFINFPVARPFWYIFFFLKKIKNYKLVPLIHDVDSLRGGANVDTRRLASCNMVISHNSEMSFFLSNYISKRKIREIEIFDYLVESKCEVQKCLISSGRGIIYAGNLSRNKCEFIYEENSKLYLFGVNYDVSNNPRYMGSFDANHPHNLITDGIFFGLIWDGNSSATCSGEYGDYLRFNNPHKTSLYIAMGIPVIIWKEAALADFIINNKIGYAVSSLVEAESILDKITIHEYIKIKENTKLISEKIRNGFYTNKVLNEVIDVLQQS